MKTIIIIITSIVSIAVSAGFNDFKITQINVYTAQNRIEIEFDKDLTGCTEAEGGNTNDAYLDTEGDLYKEAYSAILAAFTTGRKVSGYISSSCIYGNMHKITAVYISN